jgi:pimeloyl-ACP methyl ester carboxylesterase
MPGMKVIAVDLPGHGRSDGSGRHSISDYAHDVLDFIHALKLPRVIIAGHSMGGAIAVQAVLLAPERFTGLIPVCSGAVCSIPEEIVSGLSNPALNSNTMDWLMERLVNPSGDTKWVEQTRMAVSGTRQGVLFGDLYACMNYNLQDVCRGIRLPTLVCAGTQDRFVTSPYTRQLAELIPGARYAVIPGGHLLPLEKPEELAAEIRPFIQSISSPACPVPAQ